MLTRRLLLTGALGLAACGGGAGPAIVRFREANDHVVIPVGFGGAEGLALLDNGAPMTSLDARFAREAELQPASVGDGLAPLDMRVGDAAVRIHPFLEDMSEAAIATDAPVTAIAGMELFDAFVVDLAFSTGVMALHRRGGSRPPNARRRLRLDEGPAPHPRVEAVINGHPVQAFLDLGCSAALLVSPALASDLRLTEGRPVSTRQVILSGNQGLGLGVSRLTSIDRLEFAGHSFADTPIDILPENAGPFTGLDAIVGIPLLRKFDLALDLPGRLHIGANSRAGQPFERRMTGLQVKPVEGGLLIRHVAEGSPGAALGFRAGETIAAIDGAAPLMRTLRNAAAGQVLAIRTSDGRERRLVGARYY